MTLLAICCRQAVRIRTQARDLHRMQKALRAAADRAEMAEASEGHAITDALAWKARAEALFALAPPGDREWACGILTDIEALKEVDA